jgi:hypothetical protein
LADAALRKSSTLGVIVLRGAGSKFSNLEDVLDTFPELRRVSVRCVLGDVRKEKTFSTPVNSLADLPGLRKKYRDVLQKHGVQLANEEIALGGSKGPCLVPDPAFADALALPCDLYGQFRQGDFVAAIASSSGLPAFRRLYPLNVSPFHLAGQGPCLLFSRRYGGAASGAAPPSSLHQDREPRGFAVIAPVLGSKTVTHFLPKDAAKVAKALVAMGIPDFRKQREDVHLHPEAVKKVQAQLPGVVHVEKLAPGDVLIMPADVWHQVRNDGPLNIAVTDVWEAPDSLLADIHPSLWAPWEEPAAVLPGAEESPASREGQLRNDGGGASKVSETPEKTAPKKAAKNKESKSAPAPANEPSAGAAPPPEEEQRRCALKRQGGPAQRSGKKAKL